MDKGYESADIVRECHRLDAAGIGYAFFCLAGIAGKGRGIENARATAAVCNQTNPWLVGVNMLTVYKSSELIWEIEAGCWTEAGEVEKYEEIQELVRGSGDSDGVRDAWRVESRNAVRKTAGAAGGDRGCDWANG